MFDNLTQKFRSVFSELARAKKITESNISDAVRDVRLALLEADVHYSIATDFVERIKEKAIGDRVIKSVTPHQQFLKIVHDELVTLMGEQEASLSLSEKPTIIMLCGLQGSGKTTHCAKLAHFLKKKKQKILLVACDLQRPAAVEQLYRLANQIDVPVFSLPDEKDPLRVARKARQTAIEQKIDVLIVDTAGRLHLDEDLMEELEEIRDQLLPQEILFVANATTGQDAVRTAKAFDERVAITGTILTMLDGDARAGAAISIREVTKKPIKFEGVGERIEDLQPFNPQSMADRILGMGDVINLVRKAHEAFDEEEGKKLETKIKKATFTYNDYLQQMSMMKKMGPLKGIMKMVPGLSSFGDIDMPEEELKKIASIIYSMTPAERSEQVELCHSRRLRIAQGSGRKMDDVNRMVKGFKRIKQMLKRMPNMKKGFPSDINQMKQQLFGGKKLWH